jgi:hypothetical protein
MAARPSAYAPPANARRTSALCPLDASRQDKCRIPEVDERNVATIGNAPSVSEFRGKARLPPVGTFTVMTLAMHAVCLIVSYKAI